MGLHPLLGRHPADEKLGIASERRRVAHARVSLFPRFDTRSGRSLSDSTSLCRQQDDSCPANIQTFVLIEIRPGNDHPRAVTRGHQDEIGLARPHVPCAVAGTQTAAHRETYPTADRTPGRANRTNEQAKTQKRQRQYNRVARQCWRGSQVQPTPQNEPSDRRINPAQPPHPPDPRSNRIWRRPDRCGHDGIATSRDGPRASRSPARGRRRPTRRTGAFLFR
jgi:hypothetical protein